MLRLGIIPGLFIMLALQADGQSEHIMLVAYKNHLEDSSTYYAKQEVQVPAAELNRLWQRLKFSTISSRASAG